MSVGAFLRGDEPTGWSLWHQHAEGGPWTRVATAAHEEGLREELAAGSRGWPVEATPGDVVLFKGPPPRAVGRYHAVADDGAVRKLRWHPFPWTYSEGARRWSSTQRGEVLLRVLWRGCPDGRWMLHAFAGWAGRRAAVDLAAALLAEDLAAPGAAASAHAARVLAAVATWRADPTAGSALLGNLYVARANGEASRLLDSAAQELVLAALHTADDLDRIGHDVANVGEWLSKRAAFEQGPGPEDPPGLDPAERPVEWNAWRRSRLADRVRAVLPFRDVARAIVRAPGSVSENWRQSSSLW